MTQLFIPGKRKALNVKSKVHQLLWTHLKNMTVCQEWDEQDFNLQKRIFGFVAQLAEHGLVPYPKGRGFDSHCGL